MIDINKILDAPLLTDPWPHKVIDDVFDEETFAKLKDMAGIINSIDDYDTMEIVWMNELLDLGVSQDTVETIIDDADIIAKHFPKVSKDFPFTLPTHLGWFNNPRVGVCPPNIVNEIHDEGTNKAMALIVYIDPEESLGTLLYHDNDETTFAKEVEWKPNRALLMFSTPNVTWHKFNSKDNPRITLNFYYEKLEALEHLRKQSEDGKILWLLEEFGKDKLVYTND
jgi:hypothetical protein